MSASAKNNDNANEHDRNDHKDNDGDSTPCDHGLLLFVLLVELLFIITLVSIIIGWRE